LVNSSILSSCYSTASANISTTATELTFNGNDAVGLFKNGVLIDIIGTFNGGTANFSIDETLRRNSNVIVPKTTFNKATDWTVYATDNCSGIGNKMSMTDEKSNFIISPNPSNGNFNLSFNDLESTYSIVIFSAMGNKVLKKKTAMKQIIIYPIFNQEFIQSKFHIKMSQYSNE